MSTTVTYKDNTLTTVNNATKTLKTAGKYMEDDVILTDMDNTFVVTLSYNNQTEIWEPDCTYAEVAAAYQAGKELVAAGPTIDDMVAADCIWNTDESVFYYMVYFLSSSIQWDCRVYSLSSNGINLVWDDSISTPTGTITIANSGNTDVTQYATASVPNAQYEVEIETPEYYTQSNQRKWRFRPTYLGQDAGWITTGIIFGSYRNYNAVPANTTVTPLTSAQTIGGANYMMEGAVTVAAMPSGTAGTPTATKGTVSNHAVSVTPSVTNTTGYITGGTKTGTAVTVSASELVSGTLSITSSGTKDVTNYASASIATGGATASATKGTVSNHSVTVTPSVTRTAGYITAGSSNGTAVTVSASELVSGTYTVDSSGTKDVTNYASASIAAGSATASATKGTVSNHSVTVTPSVTRTAGWISAGSTNGTAVTVSASELVSGTKSITANGTSIDVTNYANVDVTVNNNFAIELTYNSQTDIWEPDCTFNEAKNAFINNKNIVSSINYPGINSSFDSYNELDDQIYYSTEEYNMQNYAYIGRSYIWRSTGEISEDIVGTRYDTTTATAIASDVANGKIFFNANGRQVGTASGGGGDTYTLTTVVPQQTFTAAMSGAGGYQVDVTYNDILEVGKSYLITYDGDTYVSECKKMTWGDEYIIGTPSVFWDTNPSEAFYPCGVDWDTTGMYVAAYDTNQHTIKVEVLEFVDGPLNLIAKSVTANGTYNASSDNADGYSSVMVNVSNGNGMSLPTFSATINSSDQVTSITCNMSYAECAALLAEDELTANVAVILPDSSTQTWGACGFQDQGYIWYVVLEPSSMEPVAEIMYNSNGTIEVTAPPTYIQSLSVTQNGTYSGLYKDVTVNVPTGSSDEFVVILVQGQDDHFYPDCTYAEAMQALNDNKTLVFYGGDTVGCSYELNSGSITYYVEMLVSSQWEDVWREEYQWISSGATFVGFDQYIIPSGSQTITSNDTYDVTRLSSVSVNVSGGGTYQAKTNISPTTSSQTITPDSGYDALSSVQINAMPSGTAGTPTATKGTVSNHSITVTPSVTNTTGYITGSTKTGTAVTVSASELVSGSETKAANGTYDVTNLASLVVSIPIVTYHTSSSAPTSSQGSNGDLWLVIA